MRLLQLKDGGEFSLTEYVGDNIPQYAILSHNWGADYEEVTFKDLAEGKGKSKAGYNKIRFCGEQAAKDELLFFWVDTCCIDKSSSAELSEAINSMFHWYRDAAICYAYLPDVPISSLASNDKSFQNSKWFTRGWTLQELIAPSEIVFYSDDWRRIGSKSGLIKVLEHITGVDARVLEGADPSICSVASRLSWAANRTTKRVEDRAYSLLGLFDINMPLLYGEGEKSFIRLQEEIMKISDDQSLFAWKSKDWTAQPYTGLLASSPAHFTNSGKIVSLGLFSQSQPSSMTSKGLCANFLLKEDEGEKGVYHARLECKVNEAGDQPAIVLQLVSVFTYGSQYIRIKGDTLDFQKLKFPTLGQNKTVYVRQNLFQFLRPSQFPRYNNVPDSADFWIRGTAGFQITELSSPDQWNSQLGFFGLPPLRIGRVLVTHSEWQNRKMCLSFRIWEGKPVCRLEDSDIAPSHPEFHSISGFGTNARYQLWKGYNVTYSGIFTTARTSQIKVHQRSFIVVSLCLNTIPK
jgi:hypothetical protein